VRDKVTIRVKRKIHQGVKERSKEIVVADD